jgi:hypothetical protein
MARKRVFDVWVDALVLEDTHSIAAGSIGPVKSDVFLLSKLSPYAGAALQLCLPVIRRLPVAAHFPPDVLERLPAADFWRRVFALPNTHIENS